MCNINIIGRGNVAAHLFRAFKDKADVKLINPHSLEGLDRESDLILICVSDNAVAEVVARLQGLNALKAHTAGSVPMSVFGKGEKNYGVFYPLQTFTKEVTLDYDSIPVFLEGSSPETMEKLKYFASLFSTKIIEADSETRKKLHLASVFACNFTNALAGVAEKILKEAGLDYHLILPLMKQTVGKLEFLSPEEAQTGPAVRGDTKVMDRHLEMLKENPQLHNLYSLLSSLIGSEHKYS